MELERGINTADKAYRCLLRAGIIQYMYENDVNLDHWSDEELMSIRNFGVASLDICRRANELYVSDSIE